MKHISTSGVLTDHFDRAYFPIPWENLSQKAQQEYEFLNEYGTEDGASLYDLAQACANITVYISYEIESLRNIFTLNARQRGAYGGLNEEAVARKWDGNINLLANNLFSSDRIVVRRKADHFEISWAAPGPVTYPDALGLPVPGTYFHPSSKLFEESNQKEIESLLSRLSTLFGVSFSKFSTFARPHQVDLPLDTDFSRLLGTKDVSPSHISRQVPRLVANHWKQAVGLRMTLTASPHALRADRWKNPPSRAGHGASNYQDADLEIGAQALAVNINVTPFVKIGSEVASYLSQSEIPNLRQLQTWARTFYDSAIVTYDRKDGTISAPVSHLNKVAAQMQERGYHVSEARTDDDGVAVDVEGAAVFFPHNAKAAIARNAENYDAAWAEAMEVLSNVGSPVPATANGIIPGNNFLRTDAEEVEWQKAAERFKLATAQIKECDQLPLSVSWDLNAVLYSDSQGAMKATNMFGANRQGLTSTAGMLDGTFSQRIALYLGNSGKALASAERMSLEPSDFSYSKTPAVNLFPVAWAHAVAVGAIGREKIMDMLKHRWPQGGYTTDTPEGYAVTRVATPYALIQADGTSSFRWETRMDSLPHLAEAPDRYKEEASYSQALQNLFLTFLAEATGRGLRLGVQRGWFTEEQVDEFVPEREWSNGSGSAKDLAGLSRTAIGGAFMEACRLLLTALNDARFWGTRVPAGVELPFDQISNHLGPWLKLWGRLIPEAKAIDVQARELKHSQEQNRQNKRIPPLALGTDRTFSLMSHQAEKMATLNAAPAVDWSDISPGGGKGTLTILEAVNLITNHNCRRALILCPNDLVGNYTSDIQKYAGSNWNVVPITTQTFARWGAERMGRLIETAPPNTLFVAGFDWLSRAEKAEITFGTVSVQIFGAVEFLRQYEWPAILIDEVHFLKNDSSRNAAVAQLTLDPRVKYIRKLSGTLISNNLLDIVGESRLSDPAVFGARRHFMARFAPEGAWGAAEIAAVKSELKKNASYFRATKKDWAFCLPNPRYTFHAIKLEGDLKSLYEIVLRETLNEIEKAAQKNPALRKVLQELENEDGTGDVSASLLQPYLQRLDRLLIDPKGDEAGARVKDAQSPVPGYVAELIKKHEAGDNPGKVLILTRYRRNAQALLDAMPPQIKSKAIYYDATRKANRVKFETDDSIRYLFAVEQSIANGFNLQLANRQIRVDVPFAPGDLEQAESRIFRPDVGNKYGHKDVFIDWVMVDNTLHVAKSARLISKMIDKALFDEFGNPDYANLTPLPPVRLTLDTFRNSPGWESFGAYLQQYGQLVNIRETEFDRAKTLAEEKKDGFWTEVKGTALPEGSKIVEVPLFPYGVPNDPMGHSYVAVSQIKLSSEGTLEDGSDLKGMLVKTDRGHGRIVNANVGPVTDPDTGETTISVSSVTVQYADAEGTKERFGQATIGFVYAAQNVPDEDRWVYTEAHDPLEFVDGKLVTTRKEALAPTAKKTQPPVKQPAQQEVAEEAELPPKQPLSVRVKEKTADKKLELGMVSLNGVPTLYFWPEDEDFKQLKKSDGVVVVEPYLYSEIRYLKDYETTLKYLDRYFEIAPRNLEYLEEKKALFETARRRRFDVSLFDKNKPNIFQHALQARKKLPPPRIKVHVLIEDDSFYLVVDHRDAPAARRLRNKLISGMPAYSRWDETDVMAYWMLPPGAPKKRLKEKVQEIQSQGFTITNLDEIKEAYRNLNIR